MGSSGGRQAVDDLNGLEIRCNYNRSSEPEVRQQHLDNFGPSELRELGPLRFRGLEWSRVDRKGL